MSERASLAARLSGRERRLIEADGPRDVPPGVRGQGPRRSLGPGEFRPTTGGERPDTSDGEARPGPASGGSRPSFARQAAVGRVDSRRDAARLLGPRVPGEIGPDDVTRDGEQFALTDDAQRRIAEQRAADQLEERVPGGVGPDDVTRDGEQFALTGDAARRAAAADIDEQTAFPVGPDDITRDGDQFALDQDSLSVFDRQAAAADRSVFEVQAEFADRDVFEVQRQAAKAQAQRQQQRDDTVVGDIADAGGSLLDSAGDLPGSDVAGSFAQGVADAEDRLTDPIISGARDVGGGLLNAPVVEPAVDTTADVGGDVLAGIEAKSRGAEQTITDVTEPVAGAVGRQAERASPGQAFGLAGNPGGAGEGDITEPQTSGGRGAAEVFGGAGETLAAITGGLPKNVIQLGGTTAGAAGALASNIDERGLLAGSAAAAGAGAAATVESAERFEVAAREQPARTAGQLVGGSLFGAAGSRAAFGAARRAPGAARALRDRVDSGLDLRRLARDETAMAGGGRRREQTTTTIEAERADVDVDDPRLSGLEGVEELTPGEAFQRAREQLRREAPGDQDLSDQFLTEQAREAAIERRAAELQLRLQARESGLPFDEAIPESQRFGEIERVRERLFSDQREGAGIDAADARTRSAAAQRGPDAEQTTTADAFRDAAERAAQTAAAATRRPDGDGMTATAGLFAGLEGSDREQTAAQAFGTPPAGATLGAFATPAREQTVAEGFATPAVGETVGDLADERPDTRFDFPFPAPGGQTTGDLTQPTDTTFDFPFPGPGPDTTTGFDTPGDDPGTPLLTRADGDPDRPRPRLPDDRDGSDLPRLLGSGGDEQQLVNPVATASEVLDVDATPGVDGPEPGTRAPVFDAPDPFGGDSQ